MALNLTNGRSAPFGRIELRSKDRGNTFEVDLVPVPRRDPSTGSHQAEQEPTNTNALICQARTRIEERCPSVDNIMYGHSYLGNSQGRSQYWQDLPVRIYSVDRIAGDIIISVKITF